MGHIAHLRKQFKSWLYHNLDLEKKKTIFNFMRIYWFFIEKTWIPFIQACFVPSLVNLVQWFWRRRCKYEKFTTTTMTTMTTTMDKGQILIRKAHLSLRLRWAKKVSTCSLKILYPIYYLLYPIFDLLYQGSRRIEREICSLDLQPFWALRWLLF